MENRDILNGITFIIKRISDIEARLIALEELVKDSKKAVKTKKE